MADRLIPTGYATPTLAWAAVVNGDRIIFEATAALLYAAQDLRRSAVNNVTVLNQRGARIFLTTANNTSVEMGSGWVFGEAGGDATKGFDITLSGNPGGAGGVVYVASGKSVTLYDTDVHGTNTSGDAVRVEGGVSAATLTAKRCTLQAWSGAPANPNSGSSVLLAVSGGAANCTANLYDCELTGQGAGGGTGLNLAAGTRGIATVERCSFHDASWGCYVPGTGGLTVRYSEFHDLNAWGVENATGATNPPIVIKRCTFGNNATGDYSPNPGAKNGVVVDSCYFETMRVQSGAGTWAKNHYDAVVGAPGATDVNTLIAACDFANWAASDFDLGAASDLIDVGNDAGGEGLDILGRPAISGAGPDVGPFEFQTTDCGIASLDQPGAASIRVTFVASPAGPQIPLQASAETEGNWAVAGDAGPLALVTAARVADLVYDLTFDRSIEPGETVGVDSSLVATDSGGLCDDPGVDVLVSVWGGLLSATLDDAQTLRLTYIDGGPNTAPVEADAIDVAKVVVTGALGGLAATAIVKASDFVYVATLARPTAPGEACTVDLTAGGVVATIGGGEVAVPGVLPFAGVQWSGGVAKRAEAITPTEIRVEFDDASWYSWPSLASAGRAASWTVRLQGGAVVPVAAAREESRYVYILTTAIPMSNRLFEVVTDAVLSAHGGTCA